MLTNRINLLRQQEVVHLICLGIGLLHLTFSLVLGRRPPHLLHLSLELFETVLVLSAKLVGDLHGGMYMRSEIVLACELEHVSVESGHLWLNVIEEVGLLHVGALYLHGNLLKELSDGQFLTLNLLL